MAQRRMFSLKIVDTDAFLEMPISSQLLYFHFAMRADDEGFIGSPKKIMKIVGLNDDDIKILISKRFVLVFNSGVVVIKHWLIHNTIRMDRFGETTYQKEKKSLKTKGNKAYTEKWQPNGNQVATQVKLSKVKLSKKDSQSSSLSPVSVLKEPTLTLVKQTYKSKYQIAKQKGIRLKTPRRSDRQQDTFPALKIVDYFREEAQRLHGFQFFKVQDESRNKKIRKLVIRASQECDCRKLIDWWLGGAGEWADYEPDNCFTTKQIEKFLNKKLKKEDAFSSRW